MNFQYPRIRDIRRGLTEEKAKFVFFFKYASDLNDAGAKFKFIMVRIADKASLVCYKCSKRQNFTKELYTDVPDYLSDFRLFHVQRRHLCELL